MNHADMQQTAMQMLRDANLPVPQSIAIGRQYLVETYMPEYDLNELFQLPSMISDRQCLDIFKQVGVILKSLHGVKFKGYGELTRQESTGQLQGVFNNWSEYFDRDYPLQVIAIAKRHLFNQTTCDQLYMTHDQLIEYMAVIYDRIRPHLLSFDDPSFLHTDLCNNNIRVSIASGSIDNLADLNVKVNGIIDFADAISGDGLYDIGRMLSHARGDYRFVDAIAAGYFNSPITAHQKEMIIFYALSFASWMLEISDKPDELVKYNTTKLGCPQNMPFYADIFE
eukprot:gene4088-4766_t